MDPFIGEIKLVSFNFPPRNWAFCNGQLLPIQQNQALFSLLGTTFGGDGVRTFGLPNLQGSSPIHPDPSNGYGWGAKGGEAQHTLTLQEMPNHSHQAVGASDNQSVGSPANAYWGGQTVNAYSAAVQTGTTTMMATAATGQTQPHDNMQPYLTMNYIIALTGIFPSRS